MEKEEKTKTMESKEPKLPDEVATELRQLREYKEKSEKELKLLQEHKERSELEKWIRKQCEDKQIPCDDKLLKGLVRIKEQADITEHLDQLKALGLKPLETGERVRSRGPGETVTVESKNGIPAKAGEQLDWLRS